MSIHNLPDLLLVDSKGQRRFIRWEAVSEINLDAPNHAIVNGQRTVQGTVVLISLLVPQGDAGGETIRVEGEQAERLRDYLTSHSNMNSPLKYTVADFTRESIEED